MPLKIKILLRIYILTLLIIVAMSLTYYYLFTQDVRERSHQSISMAFHLIFYDLQSRMANLSPKIDDFARRSLANKMALVEMFRNEQAHSEQAATVPYVTRTMTYLGAIANDIREFGDLIDATEFLLYDRQQRLLAAYRDTGGPPLTGVYLPSVRADALVASEPGDIWYGLLHDLNEIPLRPFPADLRPQYQEEMPDAPRVRLGTAQGMVTLQYTIPVFNNHGAAGLCVIHVGIHQHDVEDYSRVSQSRVNVFVGTDLSVGTLPEYRALPEDAAAARQNPDLSADLDLSTIAFSHVEIGSESYYQGTLPVGDGDRPAITLTVLFPRELEQRQKQKFFAIVAVVTLIFSMLAIAVAFGLSVGIVRPIKMLEQTVEQFRSKDFTVRSPIDSNDEIGTLSRAFNAMAAQLQTNFEKIHAQMGEIRRLNTHLEDRVKHRTAELEAVNQELQDFAYVVSHDLKAPLRGIARLSGWLAHDYGGAFDAQGQEMLDLLVSQVHRMNSLIDGILQYSRVGRMSGEHEPIETAALVRDVLAMLAVPDHVTLTIADHLPTVMGDPIQMRQVFQNLLSNAVKYLDKPEGDVRVDCRDTGDFWQFSVTDNGQGIEARNYDRIFHIFQTAQSHSDSDSTGIGLTIVKKIVELSGGSIWVESTPGQGSAFFFTWPHLPERP